MRTISRLLLGAAFSSTALLSACDDDIVDNDENVSTALDTGFILTTEVGISTVVSNFVQYVETIPNTSIDNSVGTSFENFIVRGQIGNQLFVGNPDGTGGVTKIKVSATGEIKELESLSTIAAASPVEIIDKNTGYLDDRNNLDIEIFDPSTMLLTGTIDMSDALVLPNAERNTYQDFIIRDDKMFVSYRPRTGNAYISDSLIFHVIDLNTHTYEKTIVLDGHKTPIATYKPVIDEQGNIFIATQGDVNVPNLFKPSIVKIPTGETEFDPDYNFNPIDLIPSGTALPVQLVTQFIYGSNGTAYILGGVEVPPTILGLFAEKGGPFDGNWTQEDFGVAFDALFTEASAKWIEVDLNAQTVNIIDNIPLTGAFASDYATKIDGELYFAISSSEEIALYKHDPITKTSSLAFDIADGGNTTGLYDLSE